MFKFGLGFNLGAVGGKAGAVVPPTIVTNSLFNRATTTGMTTAGDTGALTVGVLFRTAVSGYVSKVWFWKTAADTATSRTVGVYDMFSTTLLGSGTSTGEAAGPAWVSVNLSAPLRINPTIRYIASVHFPNGHYAAQTDAYTAAVTSGFLEAMSDTDPQAGAGNGRYHVGASLAFPELNFGAPSYYVDLDFEYPEWPSATNTGVPAGTTLTPVSGTVTINTNDTIYEDKHVTGNIVIAASNVIIRRCKITSGTPFHVLYVQSGGNITLEDCEIDGNGTSVSGILGLGAMRRLNIHGVENGINLTGASDVRDCYIHSFDNTVSGDPHYDGIEVDGGGNHTLIHNRVILNKGQTAAVMFNNEFAGLSNIEVSYNWISGGGYTLYVDDRKSAVNTVDASTIKIHHNKIGTGTFGYFAIWADNFPPAVVPTNNYDAVTGLPV